jgi:hypothetical protein
MEPKIGEKNLLQTHDNGSDKMEKVLACDKVEFQASFFEGLG